MVNEGTSSSGISGLFGQEGEVWNWGVWGLTVHSLPLWRPGGTIYKVYYSWKMGANSSPFSIGNYVYTRYICVLKILFWTMSVGFSSLSIISTTFEVDETALIVWYVAILQSNAKYQ
jgi:hypothetical protein